jgi:hypothetical protein
MSFSARSSDFDGRDRQAGAAVFFPKGIAANGRSDWRSGTALRNATAL